MKNKIWKKGIIIGCFTILLLSSVHITCAISYEETLVQSKQTKEMLNPLNPRYFYDVDVLVISRQFDITELNGFHETQKGNGIDAKITLFGEHLSPINFFIIWDNSVIVHSGGGINVKIELFNYDGWMFGHTSTTILLKIPLKMYGHSDEVKVTIYRG